MKKPRIPRNVIHLDGLPWFKRAGQAWGTYDVAAEYLGISRSSVAVYVWKHRLRTITYGRHKLVRKPDIDRACGAITGEPLPSAAQNPLRARRR